VSGAIQGRIDDREALAVFMDGEADAFASSTVDNYTRSRARHDAHTILGRADLADDLARARAEAFPLALILVAQTVEGVLAPQADDRAAQLDGVIGLAEAVFDRRPAPSAVTPAAWAAARAEIARWLGGLARRPVRPTNEIVDPLVGPMLALMPIHDALGPDDFPWLRSAMRNSVAAIHARCKESADAPSLTRMLARRAT
jgi:hypothetical protein